MASLGENLRTFLMSSTALDALVPSSTLPGRIQQNKIDENAPYPYVWYQRSSSIQELLLNGDPAFKQDFFDIEAVSDDIDEAIDIAGTLKTLLNGYRGAMGDQQVQAVFVDDHSDDYIPRNDFADQGVHIATMVCRIFHGGCT